MATHTMTINAVAETMYTGPAAVTSRTSRRLRQLGRIPRVRVVREVGADKHGRDQRARRGHRVARSVNRSGTDRPIIGGSIE